MTATMVDLYDLVVAQDPTPCESIDHIESGGDAKWLDIRVCGCDIAKCPRCAGITRRQLELARTWTCMYCRGKIGAGPLGKFLRIVPL